MLWNTLIAVGGLFTVLGFAGLFFLVIHPLIDAVRELRNKNNSPYEDFDHKKIRLKNAYRILGKAVILFLFVGLGCLLPGLWVKYAPRGNDSLFSKDAEGASTGNDNIGYQQNQGNGTAGNNVASNGSGYSYYIVVSGNTISVNEQEIGGTEEFAEYIKQLDRRHTVFLVDDFAVSPTYHQVEELLGDNGMNYKIGSDE